MRARPRSGGGGSEREHRRAPGRAAGERPLRGTDRRRRRHAHEDGRALAPASCRPHARRAHDGEDAPGARPPRRPAARAARARRGQCRVGRRCARVHAAPVRPAAVGRRRALHAAHDPCLAEIPACYEIVSRRDRGPSDVPCSRVAGRRRSDGACPSDPRRSAWRGVLRDRGAVPGRCGDARTCQRADALVAPRAGPATADPGSERRSGAAEARSFSRAHRETGGELLLDRRPLPRQPVAAGARERPRADPGDRTGATPQDPCRRPRRGRPRRRSQRHRARLARPLVGGVRRRPEARARARVDGVRLPAGRRLECRGDRGDAGAADDGPRPSNASDERVWIS